jgi:choice-of-anchor B domain-containing protein
MPRFAAPCTLALLLFCFAPTASAQQGACINGTATAGSRTFSCNSVDLLSNVSLSQMNAGDGNDIWGWTDPVTGTEYALMGLDNGTAFVDISDPMAPVYLGKLPTHTSSSTWRDIKVYADHAYVVSEAGGHGMQIFDLTQLRDVENPPQTFEETDHYDGVGGSHNVAINEVTGFAYIVGASSCNGGLHMVNIQNPGLQEPAFAGCFDDDGYTHDAQCVVYDGPDPDYQGHEICAVAQGASFNPANNHFSFVDVTNKNAPTLIAQVLYSNPGYAHQGWFTEDQAYFIANDELDERNFGNNTRTLVFDVRDLDNPEFLDVYIHPTASIDHNLYVRGRYAFQSNYTSGLRIVDLQSSGVSGSVPSLEEVAFFDTYPSSDSDSFNGTWSNYPFFESGVVIVSDIQSGLFVLDPQIDTTPPVANEDAAPGTSALSAAYPNPTTARTQIDLVLGDTQRVEVVVYDVLGRRVADLFDGALGAGEARTFSFDASALPAGLYFVRATGETFAETRQVSVTR